MEHPCSPWPGLGQLVEAGTHGCTGVSGIGAAARAGASALERADPSHHPLLSARQRASREKPTGTPHGPGPVAPGFPSTQFWERGRLCPGTEGTLGRAAHGHTAMAHLAGHGHVSPTARGPWGVITSWGWHPPRHHHPKAHRHPRDIIAVWGSVTLWGIATPKGIFTLRDIITVWGIVTLQGIVTPWGIVTPGGIITPRGIITLCANHLVLAASLSASPACSACSGTGLLSGCSACSGTGTPSACLGTWASSGSLGTRLLSPAWGQDP